MVGRVQEALVDNVYKMTPVQIIGWNSNSHLVYSEGNIASLKGRIVPVPITDARASYQDDDVLRSKTTLSTISSMSSVDKKLEFLVFKQNFLSIVL